MTLRDQIAAKQRRRLAVPIQVSDPSADIEIWMGAQAAHAQATQRDADDTELTELARQAEAAYAAVQGHTVEVVVQSLPRAEWEAAQAEWADGDTFDWAGALPALLAASCVDEDLQDPEWWAATLAGEAWTEGDTDALRSALLTLNVIAPDLRVPKG